MVSLKQGEKIQSFSNLPTSLADIIFRIHYMESPFKKVGLRHRTNEMGI